jgi:hypothetical protein
MRRGRRRIVPFKKALFRYFFGRKENEFKNNLKIGYDIFLSISSVIADSVGP